METFGRIKSLICAESGETVEKCDFERGNSNQKLVVKYNICYIVAGVVINDDGEVLMIQEAKPSCHGTWYLPAGRMEPNETITEAVKREVLEEAGLEFEPITVLCVEECGGYWVRIALLGKAVGGKLKTLEEADAESLQAMWWDQRHEITLRCNDVLPLISLGAEKERQLVTREMSLLPITQPQSQLFLRILTVHYSGSENYSLLFHQEKHTGENLIPTSKINLQDRSFWRAIEHLYNELLSLPVADCALKLKILGVVAVEHAGMSEEEKDGLGLTVLVRLITDEQLPCSEPFHWVRKDQINEKSLTTLLDNWVSSDTLAPLRSLKEDL